MVAGLAFEPPPRRQRGRNPVAELKNSIDDICVVCSIHWLVLDDYNILRTELIVNFGGKIERVVLFCHEVTRVS